MFDSIISGQLLSRVGGHYRLQGAVGIVIIAVGIALLSMMTVEASCTRTVVNIAIMGLGLGVTLPLYTIVVQNAVSHDILGVATSLTILFRARDGSVKSYYPTRAISCTGA